MTPTLPILALGLALCLPAHAAPQQPLQLAAGNNNPYNSPIQRANPNSRQGSMPATPPCAARPPTRTSARPAWTTAALATATTCVGSNKTPNLEPSRPPRDSTRAP
ncbi:Uncharacterised protein [Pseudomonas putida]|nr:Uncharacterised protein [Pseudomonas putida]